MIFWCQRLQDMLTTLKYLLQPLVIDPNMFCLDRIQKLPLEKLSVMMLYAILMLLARFSDQFTLFSVKTFSSARYHLSGQMTEASLGQNDSLVALYHFSVFCFSLLDQFATWLEVDIFKCWRTLIFFLQKYNFGRYVLWKTLG